MYLTLEVVSPQAASMGAERRRLVGAAGLTIGRVPGNDWVIPDPYISKHHARISFAGGSFFVEGLGRNPIAIGRSDNTVQANQPRRLNNGDRLFIDQYEMVVTVQQGEMPGAPATAHPMYADDDPFALLEPGVRPAAATPALGATGIPERWDESSLVSPVETATLDPLAVFGETRQPAQPELAPVNWQQSSPLTDHLSLPPVPAPVTSGGGIPDNWDRTGLTHIEAARNGAVEKPAPQIPQPRRPAPQPRKATAATPTPEAAKFAAPPPAAPRPQWPDPSASGSAPRPQWPDPSASGSAPRPQWPDVNASGSAQPRQSWPDANAGAPPQTALDFVELLRGAGLPDRDMSPETMRELGQALRVVVQGVMEVLHARTEIKSQFRLPLTRVKAAENNPLKLSPNVESALHTLLVQRNAGYLGTVAAFEDAFADIRAHQLAMLEGMRAAFEAMLTSFTPAELEKHFERAMKRGGILGGRPGKSKYWELYAERFAELRGDPEETFRRLFGEVFAESYEKQLERLKGLGRHSGEK
jgi:type VI secretion system FHA domain protein